MTRTLRLVLGLVLSLVLSTAATAVGSRPTPGAAQAATPIATPGFTVSLFTSGTSSYTQPDSVEYDPYFKWIYVGYQNGVAKDGTDGKSSTVVEYGMDGTIRETFSVPGHCDGLRVDPTTHLLWASSNEDGNPVLVIINPVNGTMTTSPLTPAPHGGGYDDMAFVDGKTFIAASNPNLNGAGVNVYPALDQLTVSATSHLPTSLTPVVTGNATALDTTTNSTVTLNEIDPDSLTVDPQGDVVLDNQAGSELVFVHHAGTTNQSLTRIPLGTQVDDTVWMTSASDHLLVADAATNSVWQVTGPFATGSVYTEAPNDSGVASFVGTLDLSSGTITPTIIGFNKPTGLAVIPGS